MRLSRYEDYLENLLLKQKNEQHSLKAQGQPILSALESAIKNTEAHMQEMRDLVLFLGNTPLELA